MKRQSYLLLAFLACLLLLLALPVSGEGPQTPGPLPESFAWKTHQVVAIRLETFPEQSLTIARGDLVLDVEVRDGIPYVRVLREVGGTPSNLYSVLLVQEAQSFAFNGSGYSYLNSLTYQEQTWYAFVKVAP